MILEIIGVVILVLVVAFIANTIMEVRNRNNSKISFKESMDLTELPVATFNCNRKKLNFLLDTGSNLSYINSSVLPLLDHEIIDRESSVVGFEGNEVSTGSCKITVTYKRKKFEEEFSMADLDAAFKVIKQESGVQLHGILGSRFFEKYKYVIDFKNLIAYMK